MVFTVADLIVRLSWGTAVLAGTLIPTRAPAGVGFMRQPPVILAAGERVSIEIEGIGRLTNREEGA